MTFFFLFKSSSKVQLQESLTTQLPETARIGQFLDRTAFEKTHVTRPRGSKGPGKAGPTAYKLPGSRTHAYTYGKTKGVKLLVGDKRRLEAEGEFLRDCDAHDGLVAVCSCCHRGHSEWSL